MPRKKKRHEFRHWSDDLVPIICALLEGEPHNPNLWQICKVLNIHPPTLYLQMQKNPDLKEAFDESRKIYHEKLKYDAKIGLHTLIKGGRTREITQEPDEDGNMRVTKKVRKSVLPDRGACIKALESLDPETWTPMEKREVEHSGEVNSKIEIVFVKPDSGKAG